jgi:hypothetical protein
MSSFLDNQSYESLTFLQKRQAFLSSQIKEVDYKNVFFENKCKYLSKRKPQEQHNINYETIYSYPKVYILKPNETGEFELSAGEYFNGSNFNPDWNTRDIFLSEGVIEIEKGNRQTNLKGTYDTCLNLIKYKIHFAVFYAEGMRTPHIHIYEIFKDCEDWAIKELSMALFCRQVVPFEFFHLIDTALFGQHTIALEFSKHYKYSFMNKLLFEHMPDKNNINPDFLMSIKQQVPQ